MCWATSTSISAWLSTRTPSFRKSTSPSASALRTSSASAMLTLSAIVVGSPIVGFGDLDGNHTVAVTVNRPPLDFYTPLWTLPARRCRLPKNLSKALDDQHIGSCLPNAVSYCRYRSQQYRYRSQLWKWGVPHGFDNRHWRRSGSRDCYAG